MLQGETQDCVMSLDLPCPKSCKNLWRSCVDHHTFFSSSRMTKSPKQSNTLQTYKKLITEHLGLGNHKTERYIWVSTFPHFVFLYTMYKSFIVNYCKLLYCKCNLQWSCLSASDGGNGLESSPTAITFIRAPWDKEPSLQISTVYPKLVRPTVKPDPQIMLVLMSYLLLYFYFFPFDENIQPWFAWQEKPSSSPWRLKASAIISGADEWSERHVWGRGCLLHLQSVCEQPGERRRWVNTSVSIWKPVFVPFWVFI